MSGDMHQSLELYIWLMFCFMILAIVLTIIYLKIVMPFLEERNYIKMEMKRSFNEDEYIFWKKILVSFYLKHIPIVRRFGRKK